jgi:hypothetical protein
MAANVLLVPGAASHASQNRLAKYLPPGKHRAPHIGVVLA